GYILVWRIDVPLETKVVAEVTEEERREIEKAFAPVLVEAKLLSGREEFLQYIEQYRNAL
ncbi:MAG: hypothetical protein V4674_00825, partial [Patescibacteria group bacterium]